MKMRSFIMLLILIISTTVLAVDAASSGDDDDTPPAASGSSAGGGGIPNEYTYYIPLIFAENHSDGMSEVAIWIVQPSVLTTSFAQDKSGTSITQYQEPVKLVFNPRDNAGLKNGSFVRTTSPALVIGQRLTQDIYSDQSFSYSILSDRMMGFEFIAPANGYINVMSSLFGATINVDNPSAEILTTRSINIPFEPIEFRVEKGAYINGTGPLSGAFISYEDGTSASMAVPRYLKGDNYAFDSDLASPRKDEIDRSFISILPEEPTELTVIYKNGDKKNITIFGETSIALDKNIRGINSSRGKIDVSIHNRYDYGGLTRKSMIQLFAGSEMRAGEMFASPTGFSSHYAVPNQATGFITLNYNGSDPNNRGYFLSMRQQMNITKYDTYAMISVNDAHIVLANDSLFSIVTSPGLTENPMYASTAFVNIPLNAQSGKNISGLEATWYRFPNLAVGNITVVPGPIEEYTGQVIRIEIKSNGSLPVSHFKLEIIIDEEEPIEKEFDFFPANETMVFEYDRFLEYGKEKINVTIRLDIDNEVNEINEDDNEGIGDFNVNENIRLRFSVVLAIALVILYFVFRIRKWLLNQKKVSRAHVDVLITEEVVE